MSLTFLRRSQSPLGVGTASRWYALGILAYALVLVPRVAEAQHTIMLDTVGIKVPGPAVSESTNRKFSESGHPASVSVVSTDTQHRRWPWVMLGGGILGGAATTAFALANCDRNCNDDGGLAFIPYIFAIGAGVGALLGALVGLGVDAH